MKNLSMKQLALSLMLSTSLAACSSGTEPSAQSSKNDISSIAKLDISLINPASLINTPSTVPCTLENGIESNCVKIVTKYMPDGQPIGPFCPQTLDDVGGIWDWDGENPGLYRLDRAFFEMLDEQGFTFFDEDGRVHTAGQANTRPVEDHACIHVSEDEAVEITMLIPQSPILSETTSRLGTVSKVGLALDGVPIFSDAPSVLHTDHLPALDTCAGHIDPGGWYHFHGTASDLDAVYRRENVDAKCALKQAPSALFGFAFDGFPIYGSLEQDGSTPKGLDSCGGHSAAGVENVAQTYHYHAAETFPNLPQCISGVMAQNNFVTTAGAGVGATRQNAEGNTRLEPPGGGRPQRGGGQGPGGMPPGFDTAGETLGVPAKDLFEAMEAAGGRNADLKAVAETLGVSEDALRQALPQPPQR